MIADMICNKKRHPLVTEIFIIGRKLNISLVFVAQAYFLVQKNVTINSDKSRKFKGQVTFFKNWQKKFQKHLSA